jgi:glycosyltransferase involved in cell wall biosynthesis
MGTSKRVVEEYELDRFQSRGITVGAAHCGFDVTEYSSNYTKIHAGLCREFGWEASSKILLFVGRLESDDISYLGQSTTNKNPAFALEIARKCMARDQSLRLLMVGAVDTKRIEFEAQIDKWQLGQRIRFTGVRHDVPRLMSGADLLLVPSLAEGLGMVVVEAQAAGLRVLASDNIPGEAVVNSELVTFAQVDAKAEVWANKALQLINLPRLETGKCNQLVKLSPFSIENSAKRLLKLYSEH